MVNYAKIYIYILYIYYIYINIYIHTYTYTYIYDCTGMSFASKCIFQAI